MSEDEREAFERHFFECARCLEEVKRHWALESELRRAATSPGIRATERPRRRPWLLMLPAAAAVLLAVALWQAVPRGPARERPDAAPVVSAPDAARVAVLERLARIEPPAYVDLQTRAASGRDDAVFARGIDAYVRGDYRTAAVTLEQAAPDSGRAEFFLGVSLAMVGETDRAIKALTIAAQASSGYAEAAGVMLAKAYLKRGDVEAAARQLTAVAEQRGPRAEEARALLRELRALQ